MVTTLASPTEEIGVTQERIGNAVDMHGAGAALRQAAAELRVVQAEIVPQCIEQRHVRIGFDRLGLAVDIEGKLLGHRSSSSQGIKAALVALWLS